MVLIGVGPHKASRTAVVIDDAEQELARVKVPADKTAIAALRDRTLRTVVIEDHAMVLRLLADRHTDLTRLRTQAVCRLHALLSALTAGGVQRRLSAVEATSRLRAFKPASAPEATRRDMAMDLVADIRRLDQAIKDVKKRTTIAVTASGTSVTEVYGVGPIVAALLIGHTGDITRFPSSGHYASYNATAPIEASSGPKVRHRLNPRGNRQLNHALHMAAVTQLSHDTPGRTYYRRKIDQGKTPKEARRALKRRISDAVYRQLLADAGT
jgi:transposase